MGKKRKCKWKINKTDIIMCTLFAFCIMMIILVVIANYKSKIPEFTDEDVAYIITLIEEEYGEGETFHIYSITTDKLEGMKTHYEHNFNGNTEAKREVIGRKITFVGYFDSQENIYSLTYARYRKIPSIYKEEAVHYTDSGNICFLAIVNTYPKDEFLEQNTAQ